MASRRIEVNRICECNLYLNGISFLGRAESIDLPTLKTKMTEHKALGMIGTLEFPSGVDKLECKIKWNSFYPDALVSLADPFTYVPVMARGSVERWTGAGRTSQEALVVELTLGFKNVPLGKFKQHDNVELETEAACVYLRQTIGGVEIVEFDAMANIWRVAGVDVLDQYRTNLGG